MHISSGRLRRRRLHTPAGLATRPTTGRVREAIFNAVESRQPLAGCRVLDLFAGTGSLGLEALSRGADHVVFVENNPAVLRAARRNADELGVADQCTFVCADVARFLGRSGLQRNDLILADPPYDWPLVGNLPDLALDHLGADGLFVLEHDIRHTFAGAGVIRSRKYGRTVVTLFIRPA